MKVQLCKSRGVFHKNAVSFPDTGEHVLPCREYEKSIRFRGRGQDLRTISKEESWRTPTLNRQRGSESASRGELMRTIIKAQRHPALRNQEKLHVQKIRPVEAAAVRGRVVPRRRPTHATFPQVRRSI